MTEIRSYVAPKGALTANEVVLALSTVARTAPKYTMLFEGVVLKFWPLIVMVSLARADAGKHGVRHFGRNEPFDKRVAVGLIISMDFHASIPASTRRASTRPKCRLV